MSHLIEVKKRQGTPAEIRQNNQIPAVLYGPQTEPVSIQVEMNVFKKLNEEAGTGLVDLTIVGESNVRKVLIQDIQMDPVKHIPIHVDFREINMSEAMTTEVELAFVGVAPAQKELGGTLNCAVESVEVKCLPSDLVDTIEVDVSSLATFEDAILIKNIIVPKGITILDDAELMVAKVMPPLTEEQIAAMDASGPQSIEEIESSAPKKEKTEDAEDKK